MNGLEVKGTAHSAERTKQLEAAWLWARNTRLEAIRRKREHIAAPHNPFEAQPGMEAEFEKTIQDIQALDIILTEIETAHTGARGQRMERRAVPLYSLPLVFGLASLATLGFSAACITMSAPDPVVQATAVIGVALSLAWAVKETRR